MITGKFINIFDFSVFSDNLEVVKIAKTPILINTISPNSYGISTKDPTFKKALQSSDYLVLDGVYFALASLLLLGKNIKKNQGPDVFYHFMKQANDQNGKVFFLGSTESTLQKIKRRATADYPNITIEYYSPPFKLEFTEEDNILISERINIFMPSILFVGMTCPKQEKWAYFNKTKLNVNYICCIGAVFDWYAGNQKDIHPFWWKLRLAWLKRTIDRPEILKRYPNIGIFFSHLFLAVLGIKHYKNGKIG